MRWGWWILAALVVLGLVCGLLLPVSVLTTLTVLIVGVLVVTCLYPFLKYPSTSADLGVILIALWVSVPFLAPMLLVWLLR